MRVSHLALTDYRSYTSAVVELGPGVTVLLGKNGRGKTNFVEAIAYLGTFSSHRGAAPGNLVRIASPEEDQPGGAVVRARIESEGRSNLVELEIARGRANRARLNRAKVQPREILGTLRAVVFAPEDLNLLRGDPSGRRTFLDEIAVQLKPHHLGTLQDYQKVSKQRSAVLKQIQKGRVPGSDDTSMLEVWDDQISQLSAVIVAHRLAVVEAMRPHVMKTYAELTDDDRAANLEYISSLDQTFDPGSFRVDDGRFVGDPAPVVEQLRAGFAEKILARRDAEFARGINLVGAHRDDLSTTLDALPVKGFASHGEMWSMALTLRLAEAEVLKQDDDFPILILDDVFAELDTSRRDGLVQHINDAEQVLVTAAVASDVPSELDAHIFEVSRTESGMSQIRDLVSARESEVDFASVLQEDSTVSSIETTGPDEASSESSETADSADSSESRGPGDD